MIHKQSIPSVGRHMPRKHITALPHSFQQPSLLKCALTHTSYANEHRKERLPSNERMEFLGDAILGMVVSEVLYQCFGSWDEGQLSRLRSSLVSEGSLANIARNIGLPQHLCVGRGERRAGGANRDSILADALEAYIAAVYLDTCNTDGLAVVRPLVLGWFQRELNNTVNADGTIDAKTALQEWMQKCVKQTARYVVLSENGPEHAKEFVIAATFGPLEIGRGKGSSKKIAEQKAARMALTQLQNKVLVLP